MQYFQTFKKYIKFSGQATRKEFWTFILSNFVILFGLLILIGIFIDNSIADWIVGVFLLFSLSIILPTLAVIVRRLHDINRSGWWIFLLVIPVIGWVLLFIFMIIKSSAKTKKHKNKSTVESKVIKADIKKKNFLIKRLLIVGIIMIVGVILINYRGKNQTGIQVDVDKNNKKLIVKDVKVDPANTVQQADEKIKLYCGFKNREINFDEGKYLLIFSSKVSDNYYSMEFVEQGNVVDRYKNMLIVQCNTLDVTPMQSIITLMKGLQETAGPNHQKGYTVFREGKRAGFDFSMDHKDLLKEWNMFTYSPFPDKKPGVILFGISKRVYSDDANNDFQNFDQKTKEWKEKYEPLMKTFDLVKIMGK